MRGKSTERAVKPAKKAQTPKAGVHVAIAEKRGVRHIKVGDVTVSVKAAPKRVLQRNVARGSSALARAGKVIIEVGVKLPRVASVPRFYADPTAPGRVVRVLNGAKQVGVFKSGAFKAVK